MLTIRKAQMDQMAQASPGQPQVMPCQATWIEVHLIDSDGNPVPGASYRIQLSDGTIKEGKLDDKGQVRFDSIPPGTCQVSFTEIHAAEWQPA